ncbi:MAG: class I SAM-dependent methyltransferase [Prolixibacteraceae bacterium]
MEISKHETLWLQNDGAKMVIDLGVKQEDKVIDFGCGEGRYTIPISQVVGENGHVYSVEHNEDAIAILLKRLPVFTSPNTVSLLKIDDFKNTNTIADNSIDSIFIFDVLQYIQDWDLLFSFCSRVIKAKGSIFIYPAAIPHPDSVDIKIAISKLTSIGFNHCNTKEYRMMHNVDMVDDTVYSFFKN